MATLALFFTRGVSLENWVESGLFEREVLIYHHHIKSGLFSRIYWITYGVDDLVLANRLKNSGRLHNEIEILDCPAWLRFAGRATSALYSLLLPILAASKLANCCVFKTNQMDGSFPALISACIWRRPLYVRTGYTLTRVTNNIFPKNRLRQIIAHSNEYLAFRFATISSVTSKFDKEYVLRKHGAKCIRRLIIVGNYVNCDLFKFSKQRITERNKILYVGRLSREKNLDNAILACASIGVQLDVVGDGLDLQRLKLIAAQCNANVNWLGVIPNNALPDLFKKYQYFILPSLWEGFPKSLLEAMSAGLICIGNNTSGINEIIRDRVTGFLSASPDASALATTIKLAMSDDWADMALSGAKFIQSQYSLDAIADRESKIFTELLQLENNDFY